MLVDRAADCKYGPLFGALATLAWMGFWRVSEVAALWVADVALSWFI